MANKAIIVQILGDASKFNSATKSATTNAGKFSNVLSGIGQGVGIAGFMGVASVAAMAASAIVDFGKDSIKAASDHREAASLVEQVFEDSSDTVKNWSENAASSMGASSAAAMDMAAIFGTQLKKTGMSMDKVGKKSIELSELAGDLGSSFNTSSEEAATALRSGLLGESEPLRRFGVTLTEAKVKAKAMSMGLVEAGDVMSEEAKTAARLAIIMEETADSHGMFGRDADSAADAAKRLEANMTNLQAQVGGALVPVLADAADNLSLVIKGMSELGKSASSSEEEVGLLGQAWDGFLQGITFGGSKIFEQSVAMAKTAEEAKALRLATDELDRSERTINQTFDDVGGAAIGMGDDIKTGTDKGARSFRDMVDDYTRDAQRAIDDAFDPIILKQDAMALNAEVAATRAILASSTSTKEQKADAAELLPDLMKRQADYVLGLANAGLQGSNAYKTGLASLQTYANTTSGKARAAIQTVIDKIKNVPKNVPVSIVVNTILGQMNVPIGTKAEGGRASGLTIVGEEGPELLNLPNGSYVHDNPSTMEMLAGGIRHGGGSSGGTSGSPVIVNVYGDVFGDTMDELAQRMAMRLRTVGG